MNLRRKGNIRPQWFTAILIATLVLPFTAALAINLVRDPFQVFTPDPAGEAVFLGSGGASRYQHAGVVRHYQPSSIVVGHSLAANFLPTRIEQLMGWNRNYNLALNGAPIYEHGRVVRFAMDNSSVEQVLWLISPANLRLGANVTSPGVPFPEYLYDQSRLNDLDFFATLPRNLVPYMEQHAALRDRLGRMRAAGEAVDPRDYANAWYFLKPGKFNVPGHVRATIVGQGKAAAGAYTRAALDARGPLEQAEIQAVRVSSGDDFHANLRQNLYSVIAEYPRARFSLIIMPPLPLLYWQQLRTSELATYMRYLSYIREAVAALSTLENLKIYAFADEKFTADLRLYKDEVHYHIAVNDYMLGSIGAGRKTLTAANVVPYLTEFDARVSSYRLPPAWPAVASAELLKPGKLSLGQAWQIIDYYADSQP